MEEKDEERVRTRILGDILTYTRVTAAASSKSTALREFDSYEKAEAYSKMDGKTSTYKIAEATMIPQRTINDWANEFVKTGLASSPNEFYSSHKALFSLNELSIDVASLKRRTRTNAERTASSSGSSSTPDSGRNDEKAAT